VDDDVARGQALAAGVVEAEAVVPTSPPTTLTRRSVMAL
jgi:hypothetical protein